MWPHLLLTIDEFERMVERGAFDHLDRKVELIRGELRQMNPPGPLHDALIVYLNNWSLRSALPADILVTARTGLDLSHLESRPEPDLMWINAGRYRDRHPSASDVRLAIEVAYSSLQVDMNEKAELYAEVKAASETLGLSSMLKDLGLSCPARLMGDASAALGIINRKGVGKVRHSDSEGEDEVRVEGDSETHHNLHE